MVADVLRYRPPAQRKFPLLPVSSQTKRSEGGQAVGGADWRRGTLPSSKSRRTLVEDLGAALFKAKRTEILRKIPEDLPAPTKAWREERAGKVVEGMEQRGNKHVAPVFGHRRAALITKNDLETYLADG
jgi:hypothetical protein